MMGDIRIKPALSTSPMHTVPRVAVTSVLSRETPLEDGDLLRAESPPPPVRLTAVTPQLLPPGGRSPRPHFRSLSSTLSVGPGEAPGALRPGQSSPGHTHVLGHGCWLGRWSAGQRWGPATSFELPTALTSLEPGGQPPPSQLPAQVQSSVPGNTRHPSPFLSLATFSLHRPSSPGTPRAIPASWGRTRRLGLLPCQTPFPVNRRSVPSQPWALRFSSSLWAACRRVNVKDPGITSPSWL